MKKILLMAVVFALLLSLVGCGSDKPTTAIDKCRNKVVEIGQQFLDYEITADEAKEQLNSIIVPETETGRGSTSLRADIGMLVFMILDAKNPYSNDYTYDDIAERVSRISDTDYNR